MDKGNRSGWIIQISEFIGEYIGKYPGYSPLVLAEALKSKFLISLDEAKKLVDYAENELSMSKLGLAAIELNLTFNCNLACDYCFVRRKSAHDRMAFTTAKKAIDLLLERAAVPSVDITLIGGEPLLEFALIKQIVAYAMDAARKHNLRINWAITTNGTLIDEEALKFFAQHKINVLLSIDGGPESHDRYRRTKNGEGTWHKIVDLIPLIKKYQPWSGARMTVSTEALDNMREDFRQLIDLGLNYLIIAPAHGPKLWSKKQIEKYGLNLVAILHDYHELKRQGIPLFIEEFEQKNEYEGWGCRAGKSSLAVAPDGSVSPCSKLLGLEDEAGRYIIGNVNEAIDVKLLEPFRYAISRQPQHCKRCFMKCCGGCYAVNFEQTGNHFIPSEETCLFWMVRQEINRIPRSLAIAAPNSYR